MPLFEQFPYTNFHDLNLDKIAEKIGELEELSAAIEEVKQLAVDLRDEMNALGARVDDVQLLYDTFVTTIENRFTALQASLNDDLTQWKNDFQAQLDAYEDAIDLRIDNLDGAVTALDARLTQVLNDLPSEIQMISPYTGQLSTLDTIINELANQGRSESLTATEYDALAKTATAYDAYNLTAYQYDWQGKTLLV